MNIKDYKKIYSEISPSNDLIQQTKVQMREEASRGAFHGKGEFHMRNTMIKKLGLTISAAAFLFIISVNTSPAFAANLQDVPVLGKIAEIVSVHTYTKQDEDKEITVNQPAITDNVLPQTIDINAEIDRIVNNYIKEAEMRIEEYKSAFLSTGGTEEEFASKDIKVSVDYDVKCQSEKYLSFVLYADENWSNAYGIMEFYNLDMISSNPVTLEDLLGGDFINIANSSIKEQIKERDFAAGDPIYFEESQGGFSTITPDTNFYINKDGRPVIVFEKYEIAPGAYGIQEFEIAKE